MGLFNGTLVLLALLYGLGKLMLPILKFSLEPLLFPRQLILQFDYLASDLIASRLNLDSFAELLLELVDELLLLHVFLSNKFRFALKLFGVPAKFRVFFLQLELSTA